jgi:predicted HicB family RNase H-like nuclease
MKNRGRPKSDKVMGEYMELRMDVSEKEAFVKAAEVAGMSLSGWVRDRLRRSARKELQEMELPVPFLEKLG